MKKKKIRKRIEKAIKSKQICKIFTENDSEEPLKFLPLGMSENLVFMVRDGDAASNGYSIRSLDVIEKVKVEDGSVQSLSPKEAAGDEPVPEVDLTDWASVFKSLGEYGKVVIVESEKLSKKDGRYAIGRIEKVGHKQVTIRYYGPDTVWENKRWKIPYENVTWVTAQSRYTEVLSRYVPEQDKNAGVQIESEPEQSVGVQVEAEPEQSAGVQIEPEPEQSAGVQIEPEPEQSAGVQIESKPEQSAGVQIESKPEQGANVQINQEDVDAHPENGCETLESAEIACPGMPKIDSEE